MGAPEELVGVAVATRRWRRTGFARAAGAAVLLPTIWPLGLILLLRCDYWTRAEKWVASMAVSGGIPAALLLWPRLVALAWGPRSVGVTGEVFFLVCAATAFYLGVTFVLRAEFGHRPRLAGI